MQARSVMTKTKTSIQSVEPLWGKAAPAQVKNEIEGRPNLLLAQRLREIEAETLEQEQILSRRKHYPAVLGNTAVRRQTTRKDNIEQDHHAQASVKKDYQTQATTTRNNVTIKRNDGIVIGEVVGSHNSITNDRSTTVNDHRTTIVQYRLLDAKEKLADKLEALSQEVTKARQEGTIDRMRTNQAKSLIKKMAQEAEKPEPNKGFMTKVCKLLKTVVHTVKAIVVVWTMVYKIIKELFPADFPKITFPRV